MASYLTVFLLFFIYSLIKAQTDYCRLPCGTDIHTVCRRKNVNCGAGSTCGSSYRPIALSNADRRFMLDLHNILRNKVAMGQESIGRQPSASNMNALSYDRELENIAQCLTNSCQYGHDKCRRTEQYSWVGQNIAQRQFKGTLGDARSVMNNTIYSWYNEVKDFNAAWVNKFDNFNKKVGHYTQEVWAETKKVGCGLTFYVDAAGWNTYYMACNYGPGGNIITLPIYKVGPPASNCGGQPRNGRFPGLCGPDNL